jgi:hypothetical protein
MQIGGDTSVLQSKSLIRSPASNQRERWPIRPDDLKLLLAQIKRHKAQDAYSPGSVTEHPSGLIKECLYLRRTH